MTFPQIFPIYCDDVRREVGGSTSLIGVYRDGISVETGIATLRKLCIHATIILDEDATHEDISLRIEWEGEILKESSIPKELVQRLREENANDDDEGLPRYVIVFVAEFHDIDVSGGGMFRTFLSTRGRQIEGLPLKVSAP